MDDDIRRFSGLHSGGVLLVGNGKNLKLTPPGQFPYPSFGMNTIHLYEGWKPTYYTTVDSRTVREFGDAIQKKFADIPKFVPRPNLDKWQGQNFYRFYHRPGALFPHNGRAMKYTDLMSEDGITYGNIMHVAIQLAVWMGFDTLLIIGMEHKHLKAQDHFWGCDHGMTASPPVEAWFEGYAQLVTEAEKIGVRILNISADTFVPETVIPRDDWRKYVSKNS